MRNLIAFVLRYQGVMLFVLLEVVSLFLFITNSSYQRAAFFNSANAYAGAVLARRTEVADYFRLGELNQQLLAENAQLRQQLFPPDFARREADSLPVGRDTLGHIVYRHLQPRVVATASGAPRPGTAPRATATSGYPDTLLLAGSRLPTRNAAYPLVPARVVNNSLRSVDNYLTLNVGAADGVQPGQGVLASTGVVGRVKAVSAHYATVTSVLNSKTAVAARLKRDGTFGSLRWPGDDYRFALLDYIPRQNKLVRGDTVLTSGYNSVFPEGVFVGTLESFVKEPDKNFWTVQVRLGVDFSRLVYVYVVRSRAGVERDSLETALTQEAAPVKSTKPAAKPAGGAKPATAPAPVRYVPQTGLVNKIEAARQQALAQARAEYAAKAAAEAKARAAADKLAKAKAAAKAAKAAQSPDATPSPAPQP
jgi:rod shape-determining protein MreC